MARTAADVLVDGIIDWGVDVIFGLPGDGINGIMESLRKRQDRIRFIQVRHEEAAAFMACAYAKLTGRLGVCLATSGPGGIHLLNGLYDAKLDGAPVLAITGHHYHDLIDTHAQQDVDLDTRVHGRRRLQHARHGPRPRGQRDRPRLPDRAGVRGVAHINFPVDIQDWTEDEASPSPRNVGPHTSDRVRGRPRRAAQDALRRAAEMLNGGKQGRDPGRRGRAGRGGRTRATRREAGRADHQAAARQGRVPDDSPYTTGGIGLLGTAPSREGPQGLRHAAHGRHLIPVYRIPAQAGQRQGRADRHRSRAHRTALPGGRGPGRRQPRRLSSCCCRCSSGKDDRSFLEQAQKGMHDWWKHDGRARPRATTCR